MADSLTDTEGKPLLLTAHVSNSSPPPFTVPDIVVTTPASLINITEASHYGPEWTKGGILARWVTFVHAHVTVALWPSWVHTINQSINQSYNACHILMHMHMHMCQTVFRQHSILCCHAVLPCLCQGVFFGLIIARKEP